jgi:hypothetical protein
VLFGNASVSFLRSRGSGSDGQRSVATRGATVRLPPRCPAPGRSPPIGVAGAPLLHPSRVPSVGKPRRRTLGPGLRSPDARRGLVAQMRSLQRSDRRVRAGLRCRRRRPRCRCELFRDLYGPALVPVAGAASRLRCGRWLRERRAPLSAVLAHDGGSFRAALRSQRACLRTRSGAAHAVKPVSRDGEGRRRPGRRRGHADRRARCGGRRRRDRRARVVSRA